jgi:hypothetical protein
MVTFLVVCVVIAVLIAGGIAISVHLHNTSIKGQQEVGSQRFYAAPRRYATDLADVDPIYDGRKIFLIGAVVLTVSVVMAIGAVINVIVH